MQESNSDKIVLFQETILLWFKEHGRKFPWRNESASNYTKIISEVLLQRTKAETVSNYFQKFISKYPSWRRLGAATEIELEEILKPLGLYRQRASRLYKLAQEMKKKNGRFPKERNQVEEMSMMGQYITNAYELFILKRPKPLLDVNMARVLERFFGPRKMADIRYDPYIQELAQNVVDHPQSTKINWAILDLGAKICTSKKPKCVLCFLSDQCKYAKGILSS